MLLTGQDTSYSSRINSMKIQLVVIIVLLVVAAANSAPPGHQVRTNEPVLIELLKCTLFDDHGKHAVPIAIA